MVHITKAYSTDHAPQLSQVVVQMICAQKSSIPVWIEARSSNTSDKKSFRSTVSRFRRQFDRDKMRYVAMDAVFYTRDSLVESGYAGVDQRWLIVYSAQAYACEARTFGKRLAKVRDRGEKDLKHLRNQPFACEADTRTVAVALGSKLRYHDLEWKTRVCRRYSSEVVRLPTRNQMWSSGTSKGGYRTASRRSTRRSVAKACSSSPLMNSIEKLSPINSCWRCIWIRA